MAKRRMSPGERSPGAEQRSGTPTKEYYRSPTTPSGTPREQAPSPEKVYVIAGQTVSKEAFERESAKQLEQQAARPTPPTAREQSLGMSLARPGDLARPTARVPERRIATGMVDVRAESLPSREQELRMSIARPSDIERAREFGSLKSRQERGEISGFVAPVPMRETFDPLMHPVKSVRRSVSDFASQLKQARYELKGKPPERTQRLRERIMLSVINPAYFGSAEAISLSLRPDITKVRKEISTNYESERLKMSLPYGTPTTKQKAQLFFYETALPALGGLAAGKGLTMGAEKVGTASARATVKVGLKTAPIPELTGTKYIPETGKEISVSTYKSGGLAEVSTRRWFGLGEPQITKMGLKVKSEVLGVPDNLNKFVSRSKIKSQIYPASKTYYGKIFETITRKTSPITRKLKTTPLSMGDITVSAKAERFTSKGFGTMAGRRFLSRGVSRKIIETPEFDIYAFGGKSRKVKPSEKLEREKMQFGFQKVFKSPKLEDPFGFKQILKETGQKLKYKPSSPLPISESSLKQVAKMTARQARMPSSKSVLSQQNIFRPSPLMFARPSQKQIQRQRLAPMSLSGSMQKQLSRQRLAPMSLSGSMQKQLQPEIFRGIITTKTPTITKQKEELIEIPFAPPFYSFQPAQPVYKPPRVMGFPPLLSPPGGGGDAYRYRRRGRYPKPKTLPSFSAILLSRIGKLEKGILSGAETRGVPVDVARYFGFRPPRRRRAKSSRRKRRRR